MVGIDMTKMGRFKAPTTTLLQKILSPQEQKLYDQADDKPRFLAARWAIKEALYKAGYRDEPFWRINVQKRNNVYHVDGYVISTTTEADFYIAMVMRKENNDCKN